MLRGDVEGRDKGARKGNGGQRILGEVWGRPREKVEQGRAGKSGCCFEIVVGEWMDGLHPGSYTRAQQCNCHERSLTMACI